MSAVLGRRRVCHPSHGVLVWSRDLARPRLTVYKTVAHHRWNVHISNGISESLQSIFRDTEDASLVVRMLDKLPDVF